MPADPVVAPVVTPDTSVSNKSNTKVIVIGAIVAILVLILMFS